MKRLMKQLFILLIPVPIAIVAVALGVANRQLVAINLDPLANPPSEGMQVSAPLFIIVFAALMVGVVLGSGATYLEQGKYRRAARRIKREVQTLQKEIARLSPRPQEKGKMP